MDRPAHRVDTRALFHCSRAAALATGSVLALLAATAAGNAPAPFSRNAGSGPFVERKTPLVIEREELVFECADGSDALRLPSCVFHATYQVRNPTTQREEVMGAFYGDTEGLVITADGLDTHAWLKPEHAAAMDRVVKELDPDREDRTVDTLRAGFVLEVDPGQRRVLRFAGRLMPSSPDDAAEATGFVMPANRARHPWLATPGRSAARYEFEYLLFPIRDWSGDPMVEIRVRYPRAWSMGALEGSGASWSAREEAGTTVSSARLRASEIAKLRLSVRVPSSGVLNGGPFVGLGPRLDASGGRLRFGYELAGPSYAIYSLAGETDFRGRWTIVPAAELATPWLLLIPAHGLGLGVPIQLAPGESPRVGIRLQPSLGIPLVTFMLPIDVFPSATDDHASQVALVVQGSL